MVSRRSLLQRGAIATAASGVVGCQSLGTEEKERYGDIAVGSKSFPENNILAYMAYEVLREQTDLTIANRIPFGNTKRTWTALKNRAIDVYWEYTGTHYVRLDPQRPIPPPKNENVYQTVVEDAKQAGVSVFDPAPFTNAFVLLADPAWIDRTGVETLSDFTAYINSGEADVSLGFGTYFYRRRDGWPGIVDEYGIDSDRLGHSVDLDIVSIGITYELYRRGETPVISGFSTDPQIDRLGLEIIENDRDIFPPYTPVPVASTETVERYGAIESAIGDLGRQIEGLQTIRRLNGRVALDGQDARTVARSYLERQGVL